MNSSAWLSLMASMLPFLLDVWQCMKQYGSDSDLNHFKWKEGHGAEVIKCSCSDGKDPLDPAQCETLSIGPYPEAMHHASSTMTVYLGEYVHFRYITCNTTIKRQYSWDIAIFTMETMAGGVSSSCQYCAPKLAFLPAGAKSAWSLSAQNAPDMMLCHHI